MCFEVEDFFSHLIDIENILGYLLFDGLVIDIV